MSRPTVGEGEDLMKNQTAIRGRRSSHCQEERSTAEADGSKPTESILALSIGEIQGVLKLAITDFF